MARFEVIDTKWGEREECDTLEDAREYAQQWAKDFASDEDYTTAVVISVIAPIEQYVAVEPLPATPSIKCECVTVTTKTCTA